jgi:hypothetical protein
MAELTNLETKLAEVLGLAMAAKESTQKITRLVDDDRITRTLDQMHREAGETEERCTQLVDGIEGKKTAILDKARETKSEASEMMSTYLGDDADALDAFEFMTMAEAGEVGHWSIVGKMNERARKGDLQELVDWALPIQRRHLDATIEVALELAAREDPDSAS